MNGFLLDTNIVSELRKGRRTNPKLAAWFGARQRRELFLSVISLAEIRQGVARLAKRDPDQSEILRSWANQVQRDFGRVGRLLTVRSDEAAAWGELQAIRPLPILDGFLAATAKVHNLTLVTRNEIDFVGLPIVVLNPFTLSAAES